MRVISNARARSSERRAGFRMRTRIAGKLVSVAIMLGAGTCVLATEGITRSLIEPTSMWFGSFAQMPSRELSADEYRMRRDQVLSSARVRIGPRLKNPAISHHGFSPEIVAALQEQQDYLQHSNSQLKETAGTDTKPPGLIKSTNPTAPLLAQRRKPGASEPRYLSIGTCNAPTVKSVNGRVKAPIFTPQPANNFYVIQGCGFGSIPGRVQLEPDPKRLLMGTPSGFPITLELESASSWSENEIRVRLDPRLSKIPDSPVSLVIYSGNQRVGFPGCLFVATRSEPQVLTKIAASWVTLHLTAVPSSPIRQLEYVSPPARGKGVPADAINSSVLVVRSDSGEFGFGTDTYDFSRLNPGWVVDSVQIQSYTMSCPGDITSTQSFGRWSTTWTDRGFALAWSSDSCASHIPPLFDFKLSSSQYAMKVWVVGPAGTVPVSVEF
jgi:hypothetical protein